MRILAIESSCDETSVAILEKAESNHIKVLSSVVASSSNLHAETGGIIPENAAREQLQYMIPVLLQAVYESNGKKMPDITSAFKDSSQTLEDSFDTIAVTYGPGLIGSLLVGVESAKTLAFVFNKPIMPVNHLLAHLYANFLSSSFPTNPFPFIGLIVSGGHTDLLYFTDHGKYKWIGGTRDDAAGEALDKIGRLLELPYPAGPEIEKRAKLAKHKTLKFSRPLLHSEDFDFSFSGLKTEAARYIQKLGKLSSDDVNEISYAVQEAVTETLVRKSLKAAEKFKCKTILLGGGVSANEHLRETFKLEIRNSKLDIDFFFPEKKYTTDNAAMIGAYAALNFEPIAWGNIKASPELHLI